MNRVRLRRRYRVGVTLIELVVVMAMVIIITIALGYGFTAAMDMQRRHVARQQEQDKTEAMERRITLLLQSAKLNEDETDLLTYFTASSSGSTGTTQSISSDLGADQIAFTTAGLGVADATRFSQDDFETQQTARGPSGGLAEVSYSTTPVGTPNNTSASGLFERVQRPSDGDATQGGMESLLLSGVNRIGFQFWTGTGWTSTWDTTTGEHRLPAAVKVSYTMDSTGDTVRTFTVTIASSDIDSQNPSTTANAPE